MPDPDSLDRPIPNPDAATQTSRPPGFKPAQRATTPSPSPPPPPDLGPPVRSKLGDRLRRQWDRVGAGTSEGDSEATTGNSSRASTDTVRNTTSLVYIIIKGGSKFANVLLRQRFPTTNIETSAGESRDLARPLGRIIARRVAWEGEPDDALDGLSALIVLASIVASRIGVDMTDVEGSDDFDPELFAEIRGEVEAEQRRRRVRRPRHARPEASPAPAVPNAVGAGGPQGAPVLMADVLIQQTRGAEDV